MFIPNNSRTQLQISDLLLDPKTGQVWRSGEEIMLPKLSFQLLTVLAENAPIVLPQEELIKRVWPDMVVSNETLKQRVRLLRKALGDNAKDAYYIGVIRGMGYKIIPEVTIKVSRHYPSIEYDLASSDRVPDILSAGTYRLWRNVSLGLSAFILILVTTLFALDYHFGQQAQQRSIKNLAILPFVNLTTNQEDDYLASGMTNELIDVMSGIETLQVTPSNEVQSFLKTKRIISDIANRLDVGAILDGTLYTRNNITHFSFRLIDTNSLIEMWQAEYDFESHDILTIQREVITQVSHYLNAKLNKQTLFDSRSLSQPTQIVKAYDFYLRGREYYNHYRRLDNLMAMDFFQKSLTFDTDFALAHAGLADTYSQAIFQFGGDDNWRELALDSALKAVQFNDKLAETHKALGLAYFINGSIEEAINSNLRAVKLAPRHTQAVTNLAYLFLQKGELETALKWNNRALELTPNYAPVYVHLGRTYQSMQNPVLAKESYLKALQLQPDYALAIGHYARLMASNDQFQTAVNIIQNALVKNPTEIALLSRLAEIYFEQGEFYLAEQSYRSAIELNAGQSNLELEFLKTISQMAQGGNNNLLNQQIASWRDTRLNHNETPADYYTLALAFAVVQDYQQSGNFLEEAINRGWRDFARLQNIAILQPVISLEKIKTALLKYQPPIN